MRAEFFREINVATQHPGGSMGYILLDRDNTDGGVYHYQSGETGDQPARDEIEWWGMPPIVYTLERVARKWAAQGHPRIQIGDMTRPQGGTYWRLTGEEYVDDGREDFVRGGYVDGVENGRSSRERGGRWYKIDHASHRRGWVADIRPMVGSEEDVGRGLTVDSEAYDLKLSHDFLKLLKKESPKSRGEYMLTSVLFGDENLYTRGRPLYLSHVTRASDHADHYHVKINFSLEAE